MRLDPIRKAVLVDMAFEIGGVGLAGFVDFLAAVRAQKWATAAVELKNSKLFTQVPTREQENISILTLGMFPAGVTSASDLVKRHEGFVRTAKPDAQGKWVIGYGHDIPAPSEATSCTDEQADAWFEQDFALAAQRAEADLGSEYWQPTGGLNV